MNNESSFHHGVVLYRLVKDAGISVSLRNANDASKSTYILNENTAIFVKYSKKRMSPWQFSFTLSHHEEIERLRDSYDKVFVILVCGDDGIACLSYSELRQALDCNHIGTESISVSRRAREMYSVKGTDGKVEMKIGNNEFPKKLFETIVSK